MERCRFRKSSTQDMTVVTDASELKQLLDLAVDFALRAVRCITGGQQETWALNPQQPTQ